MAHKKGIEVCVKQLKGINKRVELLHKVKSYPIAELEFFEECGNEIMKSR